MKSFIADALGKHPVILTDEKLLKEDCQFTGYGVGMSNGDEFFVKRGKDGSYFRYVIADIEYRDAVGDWGNEPDTLQPHDFSHKAKGLHYTMIAEPKGFCKENEAPAVAHSDNTHDPFFPKN